MSDNIGIIWDFNGNRYLDKKCVHCDKLNVTCRGWLRCKGEQK